MYQRLSRSAVNHLLTLNNSHQRWPMHDRTYQRALSGGFAFSRANILGLRCCSTSSINLTDKGEKLTDDDPTQQWPYVDTDPTQQAPYVHQPFIDPAKKAPYVDQSFKDPIKQAPNVDQTLKATVSGAQLGTADHRAHRVNTTSHTEKQGTSGIEEGPVNEVPKPGRLKDLKMKRAVQRAQFKDEAEINFFSVSGVFVIALAAGVFYVLYSIDQKKHEGISWFKGSWSQYFSSRNTLEDFVEYRKKNQFVPLPRNITGTQIFINHIKNLVTLKGNEEGLYSKFWNYITLPEQFLLAPMKQNFNMRTLVIDVDTVIHSTWHRERGYERKQRPGYKAFLREMAMSGYEVVLWSSEEQMDWEEHQASLDDQGVVQSILWGKDLYYYNNHACKNLLGLNRKMQNIILIDSQARSCQLQPENSILLTPWRGDNKQDTELKDIAEFLKFIAKADFQDVRMVLEEYRGQHIPTAFKEKFIQFLQSGY